MRRAATLIELIFVLVIISFLAAATFKGMQAIKIRSYKAKETTKLSLESQIVVNQISNYLQNRVPSTVIGYDPASGNFEYIGDLTSSKPVLEWFGRANEAFIDGNYSGFADMATLNSNTFKSQKSDGNELNQTTQKKFHISDNIYNNKVVNLIFAGSFDRAASDLNDYNNSFGWHGNASNNSFDFSMADDGNITINTSEDPKFIYEKYFIVDTAYAIARGEDIKQDADCISKLTIHPKDINNTLFLFSNYRPWRGETFCADPNGNDQEGNVSILMQNITGFSFEEMDYTIRIMLDINKSIRGGSDIHFSKMKVMF
ncbi:hypothetical protein MNB_SM-6-1080 [hydrothermal vent metagenome]|uniref:Prepilin-type N-terminal cleavage/methylation domain-containing protein n=1 Tax=hydrothermal vent metagenome TaxID=652676 RepID=A0A1W1CT90_9ZZZZ